MSKYNKNRFGSIVLTDNKGNNFTITKKEQTQLKTLVKRANSKRTYYIEKYYNDVKQNNNMKGVSKEVYGKLLNHKGFVTEKYSTSFEKFKSKKDFQMFIKELKEVTKKGYYNKNKHVRDIRDSLKKQHERIFGDEASKITSMLNKISDTDLMSIYIHNDEIIKELYYPDSDVDEFVTKIKSDINYVLRKIKN